jgi:hypothetical protein
MDTLRTTERMFVRPRFNAYIDKGVLCLPIQRGVWVGIIPRSR